MRRKFEKALVGAAVLACMSGVASPALADALSAINGPYSGHYYDLEDMYNPTTGALDTNISQGDYNFGVIDIDQIASSSATNPFPTFNAGPSTGYIVGLFSAINVASIAPNGSGGFTADNTGGTFSLWLIPGSAFTSEAGLDAYLNAQGAGGFTSGACSATLAAAATTSTNCFNGITNLAGATNVLTLDLVTGGEAPGTTLQVTLNSSGTVPIGGTANGFADVTGGTDAAQFDNPSQLDAAGNLDDVLLHDSWCSAGEPAGNGCATVPGVPYANLNWLLASADPIQGDAVIPEPASLGLLGAALLTFGGFFRRKHPKA